MSAFCRDCATPLPEDQKDLRCTACGSPKVLTHPELNNLSIAHVDCDAFYAAVEKRDNPDLADKPVIIGGGRRGVVSTACYTARLYGVHSAMPMFKALKACPHAVVLSPNMNKYVEVSRHIRTFMVELTPIVEPLSIDEAFLDLTGTERLHGQSPAVTLAKLSAKIRDDVGITVSIGLSHNKYLAKLASDLHKPDGFSIIGKEETLRVLEHMPVTKIFGVGKAFHKKLLADGISTIGDVRKRDLKALVKSYGEIGIRLHNLSWGRDTRSIKPARMAKSISTETTFSVDESDVSRLSVILWNNCERLSKRAKEAGKVGTTLTLKLKTSKFRLLTRSVTLSAPTNLASELFEQVRKLLKAEADGTSYRLLGVGISGLQESEETRSADLFEDTQSQLARTERAIDRVREKFGDKAIVKGRSLTK